MRISTDCAWGRPPASAKTSSPPKVGSASIALWARHSLGAREAGVRQNASNIIRPSIAILHKGSWVVIERCWPALPEGLRPATVLSGQDVSSRIASAGAGGNGSGGGAVLDAELGVDLLEMLIHCSWAEAEDLRDVAIGFPLRQPRQHFAFTGGQSEFAAEFCGQIRAGIFCQAQQELVWTKFTHVLQPQLLVVWKGRHGCGFRSGFACLSLFKPLQHGIRQHQFIVGPGGEIIR